MLGPVTTKYDFRQCGRQGALFPLAFSPMWFSLRSFNEARVVDDGRNVANRLLSPDGIFLFWI